MDDLVIRGGMILDGTGAEPVRADLAVRDGRITVITPRHSGAAKRAIEAEGLVVARGSSTSRPIPISRSPTHRARRARSCRA